MDQSMQTVVMNGEKSNHVKVLSGVPQGSVIGRLIIIV